MQLADCFPATTLRVLDRIRWVSANRWQFVAPGALAAPLSLQLSGFATLHLGLNARQHRTHYLLDIKLAGINCDRVVGRAQRRQFALLIAAVAFFQLGQHFDLGDGNSASGQFGEAAFGADLEVGGQEKFEFGVRKYRRADIASLDHYATRFTRRPL